MFLYESSAEKLIDGTTAEDFINQGIPTAAQDFINSFYGVSGGLRHLITKSVVDGNYVAALDDVQSAYHYVCIDVQSGAPVDAVSQAIDGMNKLFVTATDGETISLLAGRKHTYAILTSASDGEFIGTQLSEFLVTQQTEKIRTWQ